MTTDDNSWGARALCAGPSASDWDDVLDLPDGHVESPAARRLRHKRAKAACARCPVRLRCQLETDLDSDSGIRFGVHLEAWREERERTGRGAAQNYQILEDAWPAA